MFLLSSLNCSKQQQAPSANMNQQCAHWLLAFPHMLDVHQNLFEPHGEEVFVHPPSVKNVFSTSLFTPIFFSFLLFCPLSISNFAHLLFPSRSSGSHPHAASLLLSPLPLPAPKFLQPSPDSLHTSGLTFITVGCADKRISHPRLRQSCYVRSAKISGGGLGRRKCLKVSHKNSFVH